VKGYAATIPASKARPYVQVDLPSPAAQDPELFYGPQATRFIQEQILVLVNGESPIQVDEAAGRIVRSWGWTMLTQRGRSHLQAFWADLTRRGLITRRGDFLWAAAADPTVMESYRTNPEGSTPRDTNHIAVEEAAIALLEILAINLSLPEEDLLKEAARLFGYRRVTTKTIDGLRPALGWLQETGKILRAGENVRIAS
jgi:hypothetical protein